MYRFFTILLVGIITLCGCSKQEKPSHKNPIDFGKAFFNALKEKKEIEPFFISPDEINSYYSKLQDLNRLDSNALVKKKDDLSIHKRSKEKWQDNYLNLRESLGFKQAILDSLTVDYIVARPGNDVVIPWPRSLDHTPDIFGAHYAKTTVYFRLKDRAYLLIFLPFYTGERWAFDATAIHQVICYERE